MAEGAGITRRKFLQGMFGVGLSSVLPQTPSGLAPVPPDPSELAPETEPELDVYQRYLRSLIEERSIIGGDENYNHRLIEGLGFSSWSKRLHEVCLYWGQQLRRGMARRNLAYEDLTTPQRNIYNITRYGEGSIRSNLTEQSDMSPAEALESDRYIGFIATRSPLDRGHKYLVYGVDSSDPSASTKFLGVALVVDCPNRKHWYNRLAHLTYNFLGWEKLEWIIDASSKIQSLLPTGYSGNPEELNEGRPGVLLVSEEKFNYYSELIEEDIQ